MSLMAAVQSESTPIGANRILVPCREYGVIDVPAEEVLDSNGRLALIPGVLGRYVHADFKDNKLRLSALGVTGLIPLTERIAVQVSPRFPLHNLTHMVVACGYAPTVISALREYRPSDASWDEWLIDVMADALLAAIDTIRVNGLLRIYRRRTEVSSYPHGRIDTTPTILRLASRGMRHRAQYSWFERTVDNPVNRCVKSAVAWLHMHYRSVPHRKGVRERALRIAAALRLMDEVTLEKRLLSIDDDLVRGARPLPETRSYYRPAIELAVAILSRRGIDLDTPGPGISLPSLLVRTDIVFEQFVRLSLQEAFSDDPYISVLDGNKDDGRLPLYEDLDNHHLTLLPAGTVVIGASAESGQNAEPDVVFRRSDGSHPLIADAKYTKVKRHADRAEVEQVALYGLRYRSPAVMTIHPKRPDTQGGLHVSGRIGDTTVYQYRVDLAANNLDAEMRTMGDRISALISGAHGHSAPAVASAE